MVVMLCIYNMILWVFMRDLCNVFSLFFIFVTIETATTLQGDIKGLSMSFNTHVVKGPLNVVSILIQLCPIFSKKWRQNQK